MSEYYLTKNELYHHGILGQKWGIRRFQNEDGSYTPQGQSENNGHGRYAGDSGDTRGSVRGSSKAVQKTVKKSNQKNTEKLAPSEKPGLTDDQKRLLKGAAIGAAVALGVGAVAYVAIKKGVNPIKSDMIIDADSVIQRISPGDEDALHDVFYAAVNDHDKMRYENMLPQHYLERGATDIFKKEIKVGSSIKVAGHDSCKKVYNEMLKDPEMYSKIKRLGLARNYDEFNQYAVMNWNDRYKDVYDTFFSKLKENGYQGFLDINDQDYSGYAAKAPVVLFNDSNIFAQSKKTLLNNNAAEVVQKHMDEAMKAAGEEMLKELVNDYSTVGQLAALAATGGAYLGMGVASNSTSNKKDEKSKKK